MSKHLFYRKKGAGAPIILLHPVGLDHSFWGDLEGKIAEHRTVISVDLRGHGRSDSTDPNRGLGAFVEDIRELLDHLAIESVGVLGLSFGGMISQEFVLRYPQRTSLLIIGACGGRIAPEMREAVRRRGKVDEETGMASVVDTTLQRWFTPSFMGSPEVARVRERLLADDAAGWAAGWNAISQFDALDRLGTIGIPTLAIAGERDAGTPVAATKAVADAIPGAEFAVLQGAPHMMQIECADRFADRVLDFLRG